MFESPLEQFDEEMHNSISNVTKADFIEKYKSYKPDYFKDSKNVSYGAYLEDNIQIIIEKSVISAIKTYHNMLSDELLQHDIDIGKFTNDNDWI